VPLLLYGTISTLSITEELYTIFCTDLPDISLIDAYAPEPLEPSLLKKILSLIE
jgi:hypothetical protein